MEVRLASQATIGVWPNDGNYTDVVALNHSTLSVGGKTLVTTGVVSAACHFIKVHGKTNHKAGVAHSLEADQRLLIIQTGRSERLPYG